MNYDLVSAGTSDGGSFLPGKFCAEGDHSRVRISAFRRHAIAAVHVVLLTRDVELQRVGHVKDELQSVRVSVHRRQSKIRGVERPLRSRRPGRGRDAQTFETIMIKSRG